MALKFGREKVALLVIDMQNAYCHSEGSFAKLGIDTSPLRSIIPNCRELIDAARFVKVPIIYAKYILRPDYKNGGVLTQEIWPALTTVNYVAAGSWDSEIVNELTPDPNDFIIEKCRYSAFYGTGLDPVLRSLAINDIVICGVTTHFCVESTARDASQRDYRVFIIRDATAEVNPAWHEMSLTSFSLGWGWVITKEEAILVWN